MSNLINMEIMDQDEMKKLASNLNWMCQLQNEDNTSTQYPHYYSLVSGVFVVLKPNTKFSFAGKLKVKVLYGAIEVLGSVLDTSSSADIYSPRGFSHIAMKSCKSSLEYSIEDLWDMLTEEGVDRSIETNLHHDISNCDVGWTVLLLENLENTLTNFLSAHCSLKIFPKVEDTKNYSWTDPKRAEVVLQANFYHQELEREIKPKCELSETFLDQCRPEKKLRIVIVGGQNVGKSTLTKYLFNSFLSVSDKVVVVDLDPGQAEFTPHSCISINLISKQIFGPNFTHLKTPYHQFFVADISVVRCRDHYIKCVEKLIKFLNNEKKLAGYPVIVNTMGFCHGVGKDITVQILKLVKPTDVIQIISKRAKHNFSDELSDEYINKRFSSFECENWRAKSTPKLECKYNLHVINSCAEGYGDSDTLKIEPYQKRELVVLSYLSQIISNADEISLPELAAPSITNVVPYKLSLSSLCLSSLQSNLSPTHILAAMNGNLVALCGVNPDDVESCKDSPDAKNYPLVLTRHHETVCYGYGIVRGVNTDDGYISINTPLSKTLLQYVNCLVGSIPIPSTLRTLDERGAPYSGDKADLPTSRESRRGYNRT